MYISDFELPEEVKNSKGQNALEKIASFYKAFDSIDHIAVGVYKILMDDNNNVKDVIYVYANPTLGRLIKNNHLKIVGHSYLDTVPGASSKWFDVAYQAGFLNKVIKDTLYAPGLGTYLHFTAKQAFAPGYAIFLYEKESEFEISTEKIKREYKTNDLIITILEFLHRAGSFEHIVERSLEEIGRTLLLDRIYIVSRNDNFMICEYEWSHPNLESIKEKIERIPLYEFEDSLKKFQNNGLCVEISKKEIESFSEKYQSSSKFFLARNINDLIISPIYYNGKITEYLIAENPKQDKLLAKNLISKISLFLGAEIENEKLNKKLAFLNRYDLLTKVQNRNGMEKELYYLRNNSVSVAIIYVDLNGLKKINDNLGHEAGDKFIQNIARLLSDIFDNECVFRAGGDEFIVLKKDVSDEKVTKKISELRKKASAQNISLAIGYRYLNDSKDIDNEIKIADKLMYEDKKRYYNGL